MWEQTPKYSVSEFFVWKSQEVKGVDSQEPFLPWIQWCHNCYNIHKANKVLVWKVKCTKLITNLLFLLSPAGEAAFLQDCILMAPSSGSRVWRVAKGKVRLAFIVLEIRSLEQGWLYRGNEGKKTCVLKKEGQFLCLEAKGYKKTGMTRVKVT